MAPASVTHTAAHRRTARYGLTHYGSARRSSSAPPPDAEVIDISATIGPAGEEFYDQYADAKLRAVGDLLSVS